MPKHHPFKNKIQYIYNQSILSFFFLGLCLRPTTEDKDKTTPFLPLNTHTPCTHIPRLYPMFTRLQGSTPCSASQELPKDVSCLPFPPPTHLLSFFILFF